MTELAGRWSEKLASDGSMSVTACAKKHEEREQATIEQRLARRPLFQSHRAPPIFHLPSSWICTFFLNTSRPKQVLACRCPFPSHVDQISLLPLAHWSIRRLLSRAHGPLQLTTQRFSSLSFPPMTATAPPSPRFKTIRFDGEAYEVAVYNEEGSVRSIEVRREWRRKER